MALFGYTEKKMKIGVFLGSIDQSEGGGFIFQNDLLHQLATANESSHEFVLFHYGLRNPFSTLNYKSNVSIVQMKTFSLVRRLKKKIKEKYLKQYQANEFDYYCRKHCIDFVWFPTYNFEQTSSPFAYTIWDLQHRLQPFFPELNDKYNIEKRDNSLREILLKATYVLTGTAQGKKEICHFYGVDEDRVALLPHFTPNLKTIQSKAVNDLPNNYLFYPAQFWSHKNHITLLEALCILAKEGFEIPLILTGSDKGNLSFVKKKIEEWQLGHLVHYLGFVTRSELKYLYQNARILVYPTLFGPENLPPLEAMSLGIPCVVSNVLGAFEQYENNVMYFESVNPYDLARVIKNVYKNRRLASELSKKGIARAESYKAAEYLKDFENLLNDFWSFRKCWE